MLTMSQCLMMNRFQAFISLTDKFRLCYPSNDLPREIFLSYDEYRDFQDLRSLNDIHDLGLPISGNHISGYLVRRFPSPVFSLGEISF